MPAIAIVCTIFAVLGLILLTVVGFMAFIALLGAIAEVDDGHDMFNDYKD